MTPGYGPPRYPAPKPPLIVWDVVVSCIALTAVAVAVVGGWLAGLVSVLGIGFCWRPQCGVRDAVVTLVALNLALLVAIIGLVVVTLRIVRRRVSWPFSVGTLVLCGGLALVGSAGTLTLFGIW